MANPEIKEYPNPNEDGSRMETGIVRFGDDWAGVFIRGDSAMGMAIYLNGARKALEAGHEVDFFTLAGLKSVENLLFSANEFGGNLDEKEDDEEPEG